MSCGCGTCGGGVRCGGRQGRVLTEVVTAGVDTTYRGLYDPAINYPYGSMVRGSDGQTYVYLCNSTGVPASGVGGGGGGGAVSSGNAPQPTAPIGGGAGAGVLTQTGGTGVGTPSVPGWTLVGTPAVWIRPEDSSGAFHVGDEPYSEVLFQPAADAPPGDRAMLKSFPDVSKLVGTKMNFWAYVVDWATAHIWYHNPQRSPYWFDLDGAVGVPEDYVARNWELVPGQPVERATMVVDHVGQLPLLNVPQGTVVFVYRDWQIWRKG